MRRLALFTFCLLLLPANAAHARASTLDVRTVASSIAPGQSPTRLAGDLAGSLGSGAVVIVAKPLTATSASARFTLFAATGTLRGTATITFTASGPTGPGGFTTVKGSGKLTTGTGRYAGAKGSFAITGDSPVGEVFYRLRLKGSLTTRR